MKGRALALLIACGLVVAVAASAPLLAAGKTHEVKTEVVSVDLEANTLTIKDEKGENKTVPVLAAAVDSLKDVKAGDHVTLTCQDNETGDHEGIAAIKVEHAEHDG